MTGRDVTDSHTDRQDLERQNERLETLHDVASTIQAEETVEAVCERAVAAADDVLDFTMCAMMIREGEWLVPCATSAGAPPDSTRRVRIDQGGAGKTYRTGSVQRTSDFSDEAVADPSGDEYRSGISVPVGDHGVLQAASTEADPFGSRDVEFAELLLGHVASAIDRIERRQELRRYEGIVETTRDTAAVLDRNGRFEVVNSRLARIYGSTPEALRGEQSRLLEILADRHGGTDPFEELVAGEREEVRTEVELEYPEYGRRISDIRMTRLEDDGEFAGVVAVGRDVSEHKERERELRMYESIVEAVDEAVYVVNDDREIKLVNQSYLDIKGKDRSEMLGMNATDVDADDEVIEEILEKVDELRRGERDSFSVEYMMQSGDGERFPAELRVTSLVLPNGEPGRVGIIRDMTERKRYERRLEEQAEQLELLNRIVRHDISNDMNVAVEMTKAVKERLEDPQLVSHLDYVLESTRHTVELTRTARDLMETMMTDNQEREPVRLWHVLDEELTDLRDTYEDATVRVEDDLPAVAVLADDLLSSVFRNILKNAVQHNRTGNPEVSVSTEVADESVTVRIADNGPGVPDDRKEEIFGKGERGLDSEGTGIGLYLVQSLVDSYDGEVRVEDREAGGSVFVVELERAPADGDALPE